jgi:hypothetical protein
VRVGRGWLGLLKVCVSIGEGPPSSRPFGLVFAKRLHGGYPDQ